MTRNSPPVQSAPLARAASALAQRTRSLSVGAPGRVLLLAACFGLVGCEEPAKEAAPESAAKATVTAPPAVTTVAAKKEEPKEENPAEAIECADGPNADFHDPVLEAEVRRKLEKEEGDVPVKLLAKVKSVNLKRDPKATTDYLDPCIFPHLTNVKDLFLARGKLRDISLLGKLTQLESLGVSQNRVEDVSALANLTKLDRLDLGRTQVKDLTPLSKLTSLTELQLDNTPAEDVSPLASLEKLERLSLQRSAVKDISVLKPLKELKFLYIEGSRVEDPYALARPGLKVMD